MCATRHFRGQGSLAVRSPTSGLPEEARRAVATCPTEVTQRGRPGGVRPGRRRRDRPGRGRDAPGAASVSDASPTATWTAGPFAVPNVTGQAGEVSCTAAHPVRRLRAERRRPRRLRRRPQPAGSTCPGRTPPPTSTSTSWTPPGRSSARRRPRAATPRPCCCRRSARRYTVRVVPFAPLGPEHHRHREAVTNPANPRRAPRRRPASATTPHPRALADAHNAGEPSIGVNWGTGAAMYQAYTSTFRVTFDDAPAAATWSDKSASATNGCPQGSTTSLDPILYTDRDDRPDVRVAAGRQDGA